MDQITSTTAQIGLQIQAKTYYTVWKYIIAAFAAEHDLQEQIESKIKNLAQAEPERPIMERNFQSGCLILSTIGPEAWWRYFGMLMHLKAHARAKEHGRLMQAAENTRIRL